MSLQKFGKHALRVTKNYTKGYSDVQIKVREATSNDPWGPSGTQMNEIAQMTYNINDFIEMTETLDKRLNDKGKNWRHVFKSLTVLDHLLHAGSDNVVVYFRDNIYIIKVLREFQYVDEHGTDQGANVRQKAKDITNLLMDPARLRQERRSRANIRDRMLGQDDDNDEPLAPRRVENNARQTRGAEGDDELGQTSEQTLGTERTRGAEDPDPARGIRLSEEEIARRNATVHQQQAQNLQGAMQTEWARRQQEWTMLQRQQEEERMMLQQQQQSQLQAQQEEWMRQQLALQQTASPMPLLPLVPPISPTFALPARGAINRSQSIYTADDAPVLNAASASSSADTSFASVAAGTYEMPPPAYSSADHSADE